MAEETNTVTTDLCEACGADVRADSQFCYNCGGSLEKKSEAPADQLSPVTTITQSNGASVVGPAIKEGPGLPSAATIQKQSRSFKRKPIQISWDPVDESSDVLLITVSVGLLVIVFLIVGIALYFK